ncbi:MAG: hypothetical protein QOI61_471, partial [Actinomycetota bacterium]
VSLVAAACSSDGPPAPRPEVKAYAGPDVEGGRHPFGLKWDWAQIDTLSPYLSANTGGTTFFEFSWCDVESTQRVRDWSEVDRAVDSAQRLGYRINLKIRVGSCWATGDDEAAANQHRTASSMPKDLLLYSHFVSEAVTRYAERGVGDFALENEVNARNFWRGSAHDYRRLVEVGARAAHQAKPDVRVFDSGLSSVAWGAIVADALFKEGHRDDALAFYSRYFARRQEARGSTYPNVTSEAALRSVLDGEPGTRARDFFEETVRLVRDGTVDAFQLHYYDPWRELPRLMRLLRDRLGASVTIEAWEAGVAWPGDRYDAEVHAQDTRKLLSTMLDEGVRRVIYLPVSFSPGRGRATELVRPLVSYEDGTPNAAGDAYTSLVAAKRERS